MRGKYGDIIMFGKFTTLYMLSHVSFWLVGNKFIARLVKCLNIIEEHLRVSDVCFVTNADLVVCLCVCVCRCFIYCTTSSERDRMHHWFCTSTVYLMNVPHYTDRGVISSVLTTKSWISWMSSHYSANIVFLWFLNRFSYLSRPQRFQPMWFSFMDRLQTLTLTGCVSLQLRRWVLWDFQTSARAPPSTWWPSAVPRRKTFHSARLIQIMYEIQNPTCLWITIGYKAM